MAQDLPGAEQQDDILTRKKEADALTQIVRAFHELGRDAQQRVLNAVIAFLDLTGGRQPGGRISVPLPEQAEGAPPLRFSDDKKPSPKEFLFDKRPITDVDRIACLAYYLTHYLDTPHFRTLDLSKLNTDAAQLKFSNPAQAVDNATKAGLLVPAAKGAKQLSTPGELYVQALPDRDAARAAAARARPKRRQRKSGKGSQIDESGSAE